MKYGQAISSAFSTLKSGPLWGFTASLYGVITMVWVTLLGGALAITGPARLVTMFRDPTPSASAWLGTILLLTGACLLAALLTIPLSLIMHGGLVHLADEILAGRAVQVGQGWTFGARRMGRTFAIDFVVGAITLLATSVATIPLILGIVGLVRASGPGSSDTPPAGPIVGICCGYLFFFLFILAVSMLSSGYESIAIRYGLVGTRTAGAALGAGWQAFKSRWKNVVIFSLIVIGLQYAFSFATSIVTVPLQFFLLPNQLTLAGSNPSIEQLPRFLVGYAVLMVVSIVIAIPWVVFHYSLWGAFFRQLTGLDVPVVPIARIVTPPAAPQFPAPSTPEGDDA